MADAIVDGDSHLVRSNLTSDLVSAVVQIISEQGLSPGERLDSQRNLAERFGVAVPTMREALRRLEGMGVLAFRHGSGIYVGENFNRSVLPNMLMPPADADRLIQLIEARAVIEPNVAARAAEKRDPEGITQLEKLIDSAATSLDRGDGRLWKINVDIHRGIASAAGNPIIEEVLHSLLLLHAEDQRQILLIHGDPESDLAEHAELVRLIVAGKAEEVANRMHAHLQDVADAISASAPSVEWQSRESPEPDIQAIAKGKQ